MTINVFHCLGAAKEKALSSFSFHNVFETTTSSWSTGLSQADITYGCCSSDRLKEATLLRDFKKTNKRICSHTGSQWGKLKVGQMCSGLLEFKHQRVFSTT